MIPKLLEKWCDQYDPSAEFHTLGFKTKSAAKRYLRAKGAKPMEGKYLGEGWYRCADGRKARLFETSYNREYPWQMHRRLK